MEQNRYIIQNIVEELNIKQKQLQEVIHQHNEKIEKLKQEIDSITSEQNFVNLDNLTIETFTALLTKYNIQKEEYIKSFNSLKLENFKKFFPSNYQIELEKINEVINKINNEIEKQTKLQKEKSKELENTYLTKINFEKELEKNNISLEFYHKFLEYLNLEKINIDKINEIKDFILNNNFLTDDGKAILIQIVCKNIISSLEVKNFKENSEIITFEETLENLDEELSIEDKIPLDLKEDSPVRNPIFEEIDNYLRKYPYYENATFSIEDIKTGINNLKDCDIEYITYLISACIINISNNNDTEEYIKYFRILKNALKEKEENNRIISEAKEAQETLEETKINFNNYYGKNYNNLSNDQKEKCIEINKKISNCLNLLENFLNKDSIVSEEEYSKLKNEYNNLILDIQNFYNTIERDNKKVETIKGFVIPESTSNGESTVIRDLITKPLIDSSSQTTNWKEQYSNLIDDLVYSAVPNILESSNSSVSNNSEKFDDAVYFDTTRRERTGMHRYRPSRLSMVRLVEKKLVLTPNTEIFKQVKSIILKYLPNVFIDDSEEFTLFINFANTVKKDETSGYDASIRRLRTSKLMKMFHIDGKYKKNKGETTGKLKESLTASELELLDSYISRACEDYQTLNSEYGFNIKFIDDSQRRTKQKWMSYF